MNGLDVGTAGGSRDGRGLHAGTRARSLVRSARPRTRSSGDRSHRRHRRCAARAAAASGRCTGNRLRRVVVPIQVNGVSWFSSSDCGAHWSAETQILPNMAAAHRVTQNIRTSLFAAPRPWRIRNIYVGWQTRSFRVGRVASTPNDVAMTVMAAPRIHQPNPPFGNRPAFRSRSSNTTANTNDHFIPGIAANSNTSGTTPHLGLYYYNCPVGGLSLPQSGQAGEPVRAAGRLLSSNDGGATWSDPLVPGGQGLPRPRPLEPGSDGRRLLDGRCHPGRAERGGRDLGLRGRAHGARPSTSRCTPRRTACRSPGERVDATHTLAFGCRDQPREGRGHPEARQRASERALGRRPGPGHWPGTWSFRLILR